MFKYFLLALLTSSAFGANSVKQVSDAQIFNRAHVPTNYVRNSGAENNNDYNITDADSIVSITGSAPLAGSFSFTVDADASTEKAIWLADVFQSGELGQTCEGSFKYAGDASLYKAYVQINSITVSAEVTLTNTGSITTAASTVSLVFPCGDSQANPASLVIEATSASAASIKVDSVYLGAATGVGEIAQSIWLGKKTIAGAASCELTKTANNWNNFSNDTDCGTVTNTGLSTGTDKRPNIVVPYRGPGIYRVSIQSRIRASQSSSGSQICAMRFSDGTNTSSEGTVEGNASLGDVGTPGYTADVFVPSSSSSTLTFEYQVDRKSGNGECGIYPNTSAYNIGLEVSYIPTANQTVLRGDAPGVGWTAFTPTGSWVTNTTYTGFYQCQAGNLSVRARATLSGAPTATSLTINLPSGFTMDTAKLTANRISAGGGDLANFGIKNYQAIVSVQPATSATRVEVLYNVTETGANPQATELGVVGSSAPFAFGSTDYVDIYYTVPVTADSPCSKLPQAYIPGSVYSSSQGIEKINRARLNITGASACSITSQSGSWITSVTAASTTCEATIATGTFSAAPSCTCTAPGTAVDAHCRFGAAMPSATTFTVTARDNANVAQTGLIDVICQGPN